jgi:hypothetical protein
LPPRHCLLQRRRSIRKTSSNAARPKQAEQQPLVQVERRALATSTLPMDKPVADKMPAIAECGQLLRHAVFLSNILPRASSAVPPIRREGPYASPTLSPSVHLYLFSSVSSVGLYTYFSFTRTLVTCASRRRLSKGITSEGARSGAQPRPLQLLSPLLLLSNHRDLRLV